MLSQCRSDASTQARQLIEETTEKHPYEQDAEESYDDSFIDDGDVDESDADAADLVRSEVCQLRNRRTFIEPTLTCPVCRWDELTVIVYRIERQFRGMPHAHNATLM